MLTYTPAIEFGQVLPPLGPILRQDVVHRTETPPMNDILLRLPTSQRDISKLMECLREIGIHQPQKPGGRYAAVLTLRSVYALVKATAWRELLNRPWFHPIRKPPIVPNWTCTPKTAADDERVVKGRESAKVWAMVGRKEGCSAPAHAELIRQTLAKREQVRSSHRYLSSSPTSIAWQDMAAMITTSSAYHGSSTTPHTIDLRRGVGSVCTEDAKASQVCKAARLTLLSGG